MNNEESYKRSPLDNIRNIVRSLNEDVPVNNVSSGHIAGAVPGKEPPVFMKKKYRPPILARGKMPGARKRWTPDKNGQY